MLIYCKIFSWGSKPFQVVMGLNQVQVIISRLALRGMLLDYIEFWYDFTL